MYQYCVQRMTPVTIAVIGHVDHGKTSLVRALTGVETDTLEDERTRGLSIVLGFAELNRDSCEIHFIDTPGHADFVRATAAGLSGATAILLVVSAPDGIQKQTIEHVKLAHLFGIDRAVVAITKTDLVEPPSTDPLRAEITSLMSEFEFQSAEMINVSGQTHAGLTSLIAALIRLNKNTPQPPDLKGFFLPIDRAFSVDGVGTIVTGTLLGKSVQVDQTVSILPSGKTAVIRGLQVGGSDVSSALAGTRLAINLRGIDLRQVSKGDVICATQTFSNATRFDVRLSTANLLKHMQQVEVLHGTTHVAARVRLIQMESRPSVYAQLEFNRPQVAFLGQRLVLRDPASGNTLAGGTILDPDAPMLPRNKAAHIAVLTAIERGSAEEIAHKIADRDKGLVELATLDRLRGVSEELGGSFEMLDANTLVRAAERETLQEQVISTLMQMHASRPCRPFIDTEEIVRGLRPASRLLITAACKSLSESHRIREQENRLALNSHDPIQAMTESQCAQYHAIDSQIKAFGLRPLNPLENSTLEDADMLECLIWKQRVIRLFNHSLKQALVLHADTVRDAKALLMRTFKHKETFTTGAAREVLGTNRKTIVPLLEHFDQIGLTRRTANLRSIIFPPRSLHP